MAGVPNTLNAAPTGDVCLAALEDVKDPELGVSLVGLGLIRGVTVADGRARVQLTFTSMGCPWTDWIQDGVRTRLLDVPGIQAVDVEVVWDRAWSRRDIRPDASRALADLGISS